MKSLTTKQIIESKRADYIAAKTTAELKALFERDGLATKQRWSKAVAAVIAIGGSDYYALRGEVRATSAETLRASVSHEVTLYVDAKARCQRFAITDANGHPVWFGRFFDDDKSFSYGDRNEQSACECAAARKAIWFASKIKESVNATAIKLTLKVDAQWLTSGGGKSAILQSDARRFNVDLDLEWIPGTENPADEYTTASGFMKWSDNQLVALADVIESESQPEPYIVPPTLSLLIAA